MCHLANVLQRVYNEAHGVLEVKPPTTLDLVGSNQFLSCPMVISLFESLCPAPFPPVSPLFSIKCETSLVAQTVRHLPKIWETWVQTLGQEDLLEMEMVTHSSILAWKIPWMQEPGRLQSMGSQKV